MTPVLEQIKEIQEKSLASLTSMNEISTATVAKFVELNTKTVKAASEKLVSAGQGFSSLKDFQAVGAAQAQIFEPVTEAVTDYVRASYGITSEASADLAKLVDTNVADANELITTNLDSIEKNALPGSTYAVSAIKSALSFANQAYDAASKATQQAKESVEEAVNTTVKASTKKKAS
jgi:phasin family protein